MKKKDIDLTFLTQNYDEVELPSKGKFYSETIPMVYKKGCVHLRKMTGVEEKFLSGLNRNNFYNKWRDIIKNCMQESFDPFDLTIFDIFYIMYWLRSKTYGSKYEISTVCPYCNEEQTQKMDIGRFPITYIEKEVPEPFEITLFEGTDGKKVTGRFKYPRLYEFVESTKRKGSDIQRKGVKIPENLYLRLLCTVDITIPQGDSMVTLTPDEHEDIIIDIFNKVPADALLSVVDEYEKYDHGFLEPIYLTCKECGEEFPQEPAFEGDFFRPSNRGNREGSLEE